MVDVSIHGDMRSGCVLFITTVWQRVHSAYCPSAQYGDTYGRSITLIYLYRYTSDFAPVPLTQKSSVQWAPCNYHGARLCEQPSQKKKSHMTNFLPRQQPTSISTSHVLHNTMYNGTLIDYSLSNPDIFFSRLHSNSTQHFAHAIHATTLSFMGRGHIPASWFPSPQEKERKGKRKNETRTLISYRVTEHAKSHTKVHTMYC